MKAVIIHADGRHIDLSAAVDPDTYAELENLRCSRTGPVLCCGGCGGSIYIRHGSARKDELFGAHFTAGTCAETLIIRKATLSDEHKRQAEYHALAAQHSGHAADLEVITAGHTRVDVVVDDRIGFEVQRSALSKAAAVDRTARSVAAGLGTVAWFTDRTTSPQWVGHVPGYRTTVPAAAWQGLPLPGTVTAAGLQAVEAVRCGTRSLCRHRRRPCNLFIPWLGAWDGLHVDDVVTGLAENQIRPVRVGKYVQLMSIGSIALYEELTGTRLVYAPGPLKVALPPSGRVECTLPPLRLPPGAPAPVHDLFEAGLSDPDWKAHLTHIEPLCRQTLCSCASAAVSGHAALTRSRFATNATARPTSSSPGCGHEARPHSCGAAMVTCCGHDGASRKPGRAHPAPGLPHAPSSRLTPAALPLPSDLSECRVSRSHETNP